MTQSATSLITSYYAAFNAGDFAAMVALLTDDVVHDINQGARETGREAFSRFIDHMAECYEEHLENIVILTDESGTRAAAEFTVHGTYKASDAGLPPAAGQTYVLPAGAFFELHGGRIARVTNYYSLADWMAQVSAS